jgi:hypothetical protein
MKIEELENKLLEIIEEEETEKSLSLKEYFNKEMIKQFQKEIEKDKEEPFIIAYNNIVEKTAAFLNSELLVEDPITAAIAFEYMLWKGYFSKDKDYQFRLEERICNYSGFGADIMRGNGVCLNNASMLSDVLTKMDYNVCPSVCYAKETYGVNDYKKELPPIERNMYKPQTISEHLKQYKMNVMSHLLGPVTKKFGNHVIVLNEYNGKYFATDPTNLCFMTYQDENKLASLNGSFEFELKPTISYYMNSNNVDKTQNMYENAKNSVGESIPFLDNEAIKEYYCEQVDICNSKIDLLDDFHHECLSDIDTVCKTLSKNKR